MQGSVCRDATALPSWCCSDNGYTRSRKRRQQATGRALLLHLARTRQHDDRCCAAASTILSPGGAQLDRRVAPADGAVALYRNVDVDAGARAAQSQRSRADEEEDGVGARRGLLLLRRRRGGAGRRCRGAVAWPLARAAAAGERHEQPHGAVYNGSKGLGSPLLYASVCCCFVLIWGRSAVFLAVLWSCLAFTLLVSMYKHLHYTMYYF